MSSVSCQIDIGALQAINSAIKNVILAVATCRVVARRAKPEAESRNPERALHYLDSCFRRNDMLMRTFSLV
jgi:hypothetical protein